MTHWSPRSRRAFQAETKGSSQGHRLISQRAGSCEWRVPRGFRKVWVKVFAFDSDSLQLDCHLCLGKSIIAQSVSLYCTVPWHIPLQLKHRGTFQGFLKTFQWASLFRHISLPLFVSARSKFVLPWSHVTHSSSAITSHYPELTAVSAH